MQLPQVRKVRDPPKAACLQNSIGSYRTDAWNSQQLRAICCHDFNGSFAQVSLCPCTLGVDIDLQIPILQKC